MRVCVLFAAQNTLGAFEATVEVMEDTSASAPDSGWEKLRISAPPESLLHIRPAHTLVSRERNPPRSVHFERQVTVQRPDVVDQTLLHPVMQRSESHTFHRFADPRQGYVAGTCSRSWMRVHHLALNITAHIILHSIVPHT